MKGPIKWMAENHIAANLLMMVFIVGGLFIGPNIKQEVFPEITTDTIRVTVAYPGAGPEEVEEGILLKVEEALSAINGIKEIQSSASEGNAKISLEILEGQDIDLILQDVKSEVDRLTTLPQEAEKPTVAKVVRKSEVISVVVYGDVPERSLREQIESVQDDLLSYGNISQISLVGVRPYEISIEVPEATLRSYGLSLVMIASRIRAASLDLPAGAVKTAAGEVLIRTKEKRYRGSEYSNITIIQNPDGTEVKLGDIATIKDGFAETDVYGTFDGLPSAMLKVYRVGDQKPDDISTTVKNYVAARGLTLPPSVKIKTWNDKADLFRGRKQLLLKNAGLGLILVLITLGMFLQVRLALWVMLGLPISFLGAMILMPAVDVSINMISLFAFILVLGIVVDDAIVVGESIYEHRTRGVPYLKAAVNGVIEVAGPVVFAILTTIAAFLPLLYITGRMGKFIRVIPLIVIPVLIVSLVECLYVLPAHLTIGKPETDHDATGIRASFRRFRKGFAAGLRTFIDGPYSRLLNLCITNRAITIAIAIAVLLISLGMVIGGVIKFRFMPSVEGDTITAHLQMPVGTTAEDTATVLATVVDKGIQAASALEADTGEKVLRNIYSLVGQKTSIRHASSSTTAANMATIIMFLTPSEERDTIASDVTARWRALIGEIPGVEALTFRSNMMDFGANINVRLSHRDFHMLRSATDSLKAQLAMYPGVNNIEDNYSQGKRELNLNLKPEARTLGITEADLASQVRSAFHGAEAMRVQRGRNEVKVMVRYPQADRKSLATLENMYISTATGQGVPFGVAAEISENKGYSSITRYNKKRVVDITADVRAEQANAEDINLDLKHRLVPMLIADHPGLSADFEGEDKERRESLQSMGRGYSMALLAIFAMLAIPFRSYSQPMVVMAAIPFGIIGGIWGHILMGYNLSILSMFGIVALSGVVVNDSLLLIDHINRKRHEGMELFEAVMVSGRRRFRPILLTSLTTFFGLAPMIIETSVQAKFLIPMAISLAFGILFATGITLLLIPTIYIVLENLKLNLGITSHEACGLMEEKCDD